MESINRKVVIIAAILALLTTVLIYVYITRITSKPDVIEYINVYVAAKNLPPKAMITEADIKQIKVTRDYLNSKAVLNKADIIGKRLKESIIEGEQILKDRLAEENVTLAYAVPEGKRAVSVNINEQVNVSNLIRPGDFVDIIASFDREEDTATMTVKPKTSRIVIQNIEVLAIGQDQAISEEKLKDLPKTVTLAVSPSDAEKLVYVSDFAMIRFALRPIGDDKAAITGGVTRQNVER
jgi:pilus assembly protein CpaB